MNAQHSDQHLGAAVGGFLGFAKSLSMISMVTWGVLLDTALLSALGAVVGFAVTGLLKYVKSKFKNR